MTEISEPARQVFLILQGQPPAIIIQANRITLALLEKAIVEPAL